MKLNYTIIEPSTAKIVEGYFFLRWQLLRKPLNQEPGSEQDDLESKAVHACAITTENLIIGVGRIHKTEEAGCWQIRYMAVLELYRKIGVGEATVHFLEKRAISNGAQKIILHARENVIGFYTKLGYTVKGKSLLLFGQIQHYLMEKELI